uniref:Uncharacterized protein n=1 Tax=Spongospora subterranea TaxID=70186 RepID=A0A0H5R5X2_9EUKA|eukprot:CRZ09550.1 hypothetical protein [Spongospora subterranea]
MTTLLSESDVIASERFIARDHIVLSIARKLLSDNVPINNDELSAEIDTLAYEISLSSTATETAIREINTYSNMYDESSALIEAMSKEIGVLRVELHEAYQVKSRFDEYSLLCESYSGYPTRQETTNNIVMVEQEIAALMEEHNRLDKKVDRARKDMAALFGVLNSLSSWNGSDVESEPVEDGSAMITE